MQRTARPIVAEGDIGVNIRSFSRSLRAENVSPRTIETYLESVGQLSKFLSGQGMPVDVAEIRREHVEAFIELLEPTDPNNPIARFLKSRGEGVYMVSYRCYNRHLMGT